MGLLFALIALSSASTLDFEASDLTPTAWLPSPVVPIGEIVGGAPTDRVVGGAPSAPGTWMATVGVVIDGQVGCTGTLVAPDVVLTAGHCVQGLDVTHVLVGTVNVNSGGSMIPVQSATAHPSYDGYEGADIAVLILGNDATQTPAIIATDCITADDLYDGAPAAIVGFGAINTAGDSYSNQRHEGIGTILDADCSQDVVGGVETTCLPGERPSGELFAGGAVDACFGDSGGPIYIQGSDGIWYVSGVTSRGGYTPGDPCGQGGVWVRPDKYLPWIESLAGSLARPTCGAGPVPPPADDTSDDLDPPTQPNDPALPGVGVPPIADADLMVVAKRTLGAVQVVVEDPDSDVLTYEIVSQPLMGSARIQADGLALYQPKSGARGADAFEVRVTDESGNEDVITVTVQLVPGGLGCSAVPGAGGLWLGALGLLGLLGLRRRR